MMTPTFILDEIERLREQARQEPEQPFLQLEIPTPLPIEVEPEEDVSHGVLIIDLF